VRAHVPFLWREFAGATMKSAVVAGLTAAGPLIVVAFLGTVGPPILPIAIGMCFGGVGWLAGLWLTSHPLFREIQNVAEVVVKSFSAGPGGVGWPVAARDDAERVSPQSERI
jgi:hypothetical protein